MFKFLRRCPPRSRRLQPTFWRLCEGGASTNVPAGYKLSFPHCFFCGVTAPLSQNRSLAAGIFSFFNDDFTCV
jgi:hypothetical protein